MTRLDEIEARANAATEGPWEVGDRYHCQSADKCDCRQGYGPLIDTYQHPAWGTMHVHRSDEPWWDEGVLYRTAGGPPGDVGRDIAPADAEFIAHARQDVPALVAVARYALSQHSKDEAHNECGHCADSYGEDGWPCSTVREIHRLLGEDA